MLSEVVGSFHISLYRLIFSLRSVDPEVDQEHVFVSLSRFALNSYGKTFKKLQR